MAPNDAPAPEITAAWLLTLNCGHITRIEGGPVQPLVHCASCGQDSMVSLAVRQ